MIYFGAVAKWLTRRSAKPLCTGSTPVCVSIKMIAAAAGITAVCLWAGETARIEPNRIVIKNQGFLPFADAPIHYRSSDLNDPIAKLEKRIEHGEVILPYNERQHGYLKAVLDELHVPVSSQALVFSKTSFQFPQITPATPRALYYNDDVYVGQVHDGKFLEFVSFDPMQGAIFYVMDEHRSERPQFERAAVDCVQCHVAPTTRGVPGVMLRSVFTRPSGYQAAGTKSFITGQESPLSERWGGWYVTAARGAESAMANVTVSNPKHPEQLDTTGATNLTSLVGRVNTAAYLTGSSDIVALMVLAHQTQMHNLITQTNYQTRLAVFADQQIPDAARKRLEGPAEQLVRYLLFTNEAPLNRPIVGTSQFAEEFTARGPRDSRGRSLRDFDLRSRIFKYPCSYLIYSEALNSMPEPAKGYIYRRLFEVLSGREQGPEFASLSSEDRRAILEILVATKPGLPDEWKQFVRETHQGNSNRALEGAVNRHPKP